MNLEKAVEFLNCTSINPDFDEYMLQLGIKKRPQGKDLRERFYAFDKQVKFIFQEKEYIEDRQFLPITGEGKYILTEFEVEPGYTELMPYSLSFTDVDASLIEKLGAPLDKTILSDGAVIIYFHNNVIISAFFSKKGEVSLFKFASPTKNDIRNLGIRL